MLKIKIRVTHRHSISGASSNMMTPFIKARHSIRMKYLVCIKIIPVTILKILIWILMPQLVHLRPSKYPPIQNEGKVNEWVNLVQFSLTKIEVKDLNGLKPMDAHDAKKIKNKLYLKMRNLNIERTVMWVWKPFTEAYAAYAFINLIF